jgi:sugar phosphate isomerase/epimerase
MLTRREMLTRCAGAVPAIASLAASEAAGSAGFSPCQAPARVETRTTNPGTHLGIVSDSFANRRAAERGRPGGFTDPRVFLDHCHALGAGGIQLDLGARDRSYCAALRAKVEEYQMYLEGSIRLPRDRADAERFALEVDTAREAGAAVLRTVMLSGRRYETFASGEAFHAWGEHAQKSLAMAEPIVARAGVRLAIENHKDWRTDELLAILKRLDSRHVGVCVDTGNSIALLEDPYAVVEAYAPWVYSTHLKDMAVREYQDGFLLAEVPLGQGFLDLLRIVATLRRAQRSIHFNLEMITRDPLKVPCLTPKYWATSADLPGKYLAQTLAMVRKHASPRPLAGTSGLGQQEKLDVEQKNVEACLAFAREHLDL